jgi:hypothetical protein
MTTCQARFAEFLCLSLLVRDGEVILMRAMNSAGTPKQASDNNSAGAHDQPEAKSSFSGPHHAKTRMAASSQPTVDS